MLRSPVLALLLASPVFAQAPGVTATEVHLGQSCALKGPAKALGQGMREGLNVYFNSVNAKGGIKGRKIRLTTLNDSYEPKRCVRATKQLLDKQKVFLLIGEVGTPTSKVAVPLAEAAGAPFVAPFTGAEFLRNPHKKWVVNMRGSYYQEMERLAQYLVDNQGMKKIACFYQNDGYGKAGLAGIEKALARRNMKLAGTGKYPRNTTAVRPGLVQIAKCEPDAVIMVGAYKPCAEFIRQARKNPATSGATFCNISFVGTKALNKALNGNDQNCIVSQVVPFPWDTELPLIQEFHAAMRKAGKQDQIGFISLEGFMAAKLFCQVLERIDGEPSREKFVATVAKVGTFDLGGIKLRYGATDNQGMDEVFLTRLNKGKVERLVERSPAQPGK